MKFTVLSAVAITLAAASGAVSAFPGHQLRRTADLAVGEYFRPADDQISGVPGTSKPYKRSPCPALNALANHGYIPRDGAGLTIDLLTDKIVEVYNLDRTFALFLATAGKLGVGSLPFFKFTLADLSKHNVIEHDASLVHNDAFLNGDPYTINGTAADILFASSRNGQSLGVQEVGEFRKYRTAESKARNPEGFTFNAITQFIAYGESSLLLDVLGRDNALPLAHAKSFLIEEKIPSDFVRISKPYTQAQSKVTSDAVRAVAEA